MTGLIGAERCIIVDCCINYNKRFPENTRTLNMITDIQGVTNAHLDINPTSIDQKIASCMKEYLLPHIQTHGSRERLNNNLAACLKHSGLSAFYTKRSDFIFRLSDNGKQLNSLIDFVGIA
jgi:hypothetical protein